jgi:cytochrome c biogenesis protein CcdA
MTAKKCLIAVLLLFLLAAGGRLLVRHFEHDRRAASDIADDTVAADDRERIIVYYFHGRERCEACVNAETYSKEALQSGFAKQLADGRIEWRVIDFDEPANRHFDNDFQLGGIPSVVLFKAETATGPACVVIPAIARAITAETKAEFIEYIQGEIRDFLAAHGESSGEPRAAAAETEENATGCANVPPQSYTWGLIGALWLGIFTAITPCTLVANIAAVSYVGRRVGSPRKIIAGGVLYATGQTLAYAALGFVLVAGLLASHVVSSFLHRYMNELLGPLLVLTAMVLLGLLDFGISGPGVSERLQKRLDALGIWGAFFLGVLFGLTFCPVSGALFFVQLVPQAVYLSSPVAMPALYGLGNAVPVVVFAILIAFSAQTMAKAYNRLAEVELWLRRLTGGIFLGAGILFTLRYVFDFGW